MLSRRLSLVLCLVAGIAALVACGPAEQPTPAGPTATPAAAASPTPEPEFDAEAYFAGQRINLIIPFAAGGAMDVNGRFVAQHLREFFPGRPNIQAQNLTPPIAGISTHVGVDSTVRDAAERDYNCIVVSDACRSNPMDRHEASLYNLSTFFADISTVDEFIAAIETAAP